MRAVDPTPLKLIVLGTGTLDPRSGRASAGIAVVFDDILCFFDLGRGVVQRAVEAGLDPLAADAIFLSHVHPDHCCDWVPLGFALNYAQPEREKALTVIGPAGVEQMIVHLEAAWRWLQPRYPRTVREIDEAQVDLGGARITAFPLEHGSVANLGYRLEVAGKSIAYTGDTGPCRNLLSLADGVDILVSECSFSDARAQATHMSPRHLAEAAEAAGCRRLVITHLYPETDPAEVERVVQRGYSGEVILARDGLQIDV